MVVESRSVIRNAKHAPPPPFPSLARLIFALLVLIRSNILSESLAQAILSKDHWDTRSATCCKLHCKGMKKVTFEVHFCRVRINFSFSIWIHLRWLTPEGWDGIACPLAKLLLKPASPEKLCRLTNPLFRLHVFYIGKCYLTFGQWFVI